MLASTADLTFVLNLQKRFSNQLGFLPRQALDWYLSNGRVTLAIENGQHAGYILGRPALHCLPDVQPLTQTAICYDAQRRGSGLALVEHAAAEARAAGRSSLQAWCRVDLEAAHFWRAAGFTAVAIRRPPTRRGKELVLWRRLISADGHGHLLHLPTRAGHRASTADRSRLLSTADRARLSLHGGFASPRDDGQQHAAA